MSLVKRGCHCCFNDDEIKTVWMAVTESTYKETGYKRQLKRDKEIVSVGKWEYVYKNERMMRNDQVIQNRMGEGKGRESDKKGGGKEKKSNEQREKVDGMIKIYFEEWKE